MFWKITKMISHVSLKTHFGPISSEMRLLSEETRFSLYLTLKAVLRDPVILYQQAGIFCKFFVIGKPTSIQKSPWELIFISLFFSKILRILRLQKQQISGSSSLHVNPQPYLWPRNWTDSVNLAHGRFWWLSTIFFNSGYPASRVPLMDYMYFFIRN